MPTKYGLVIGGALNLREQPSTAANRLALIPNETTLAITDHNDDWYATAYGSLSGYVMKQYVQSLNQTTDIVLNGTVTGGGLNLRQKASTSTDRLILIPNQTELEVVDYDANGDWYRTNYGGYAGYVMKQYVEISEPPPATEWLYGQVTSSSLNVRKQPSLSAPLWNYPWPLNRIALVKPAVDGWYETLYRGDPAYVSAQYIDLLDEPVPDSIVERMLFMAVPELGRTNSQYYNGYTGQWCHIFADWLSMHADMPKAMVPNTTNCGTGIVWFVNDENSGGFYFKNAAHKARMINAYPAINHLSTSLTEEEEAYVPTPGDYIYFRWSNAASTVNVSHVGIVRAVYDTTLSTFEGNSGSKVVSQEFLLNDTEIIGYGRPKYSEA